jgi:hypothetical protein
MTDPQTLDLAVCSVSSTQRLLLGMPYYGQVDPRATLAFMQAQSVFFQIPPQCRPMIKSSLLANGFNDLWNMAINYRKTLGVTHFVMLHSDIVPDDQYFIDTLYREMMKYGADVMSAVVPIKNRDYLTSTAIDHDPKCDLWPWTVHRRLTMHEVLKIPETFDAAMAGYPGRSLLINTGCWIADITKPWAEQIGFKIEDTNIVNGDTGNFESRVIPEDWLFSRMVQQQFGGKVMATRKVKLAHLGSYDYRNDEEGLAKFDPDTQGQPVVVTA